MDLRRAEPLQVIHAIGFRFSQNVVQGGNFHFFGRDDQFTQSLEFNTAAFAITV